MTTLTGVAVGAGYFSQFHFDAWSRLEGVNLAAVCDLDSDAASKAASQYDIAATYSDFAKMLDAEEPDFVDIITRPDTHLPLVRTAAARGIPIICQKPLAPNYKECCEIVRAAANAGVPLMVHENFRFQPWHREIKRLLDDGAIGSLHSMVVRTRTGDGWQKDAYLARQPYFRTMPRFLIFETGVHFIDTFRFLGGEIDGVYASLRRLNPEIGGEDAGMLMFEFASGASGLWDANRFNEPNCENPRFTFGEALVEGSGGSIRLYADGRLTLQPLGENECEHKYSVEKRNFAGDCVFATQQHFVECLRDGTPFETRGVDYLRTLSIQEAVYRSAETRQPVRDIHGDNTCA